MILILSGLPASGKSTYAGEWVAEDPQHRARINYDELRLHMYGPDWKFNRQEEDAMKGEALNIASNALQQGFDVVVDNTNLTTGARRPWEELGKHLGVPVEQLEIDTPVEECIRRDRQREGRARVGRAVIERMALFTGWIDWSDKELYPRDFVICDLDGTIADCTWRRKKFELPIKHSEKCHAELQHLENGKCTSCGRKVGLNYDRFFEACGDDPPITPVIRLLDRLVNPCCYPSGPKNCGHPDHEDYDVLFVSGRPIDPCGKLTEDWLDKHHLFGRHLFMRQGGDHRPDYIVKQEILDLLPKNRIRYVLDDRNQVVEMWRRNGLTCLQVADGNF